MGPPPPRPPPPPALTIPHALSPSRPSWHGESHPSPLRLRRETDQLSLLIPAQATNLPDCTAATYVGPVRLGLRPLETSVDSSTTESSPCKAPLMQAGTAQGDCDDGAARQPQRQRAMISVS